MHLEDRSLAYTKSACIWHVSGNRDFKTELRALPVLPHLRSLPSSSLPSSSILPPASLKRMDTVFFLKARRPEKSERLAF